MAKSKKKKKSILFRVLIFILSPFSQQVRYLMLKLMKRFRKPDDGRPIIAASDHILGEILLPSIFATFKSDKFRELANFKKLPVAEHDRIFNELEVAGVCLAVFYLAAIKSMRKLEDYHFWQNVEEHLPGQLQRMLIGYGVDGSNAKLMKELIDMRRKEYEELSEISWDMTEEQNPEFRTLPPQMKGFASKMQAAAIGTADHIRRGKIKKGDPLIKYLIYWFLDMEKFVKNL